MDDIAKTIEHLFHIHRNFFHCNLWSQIGVIVDFCGPRDLEVWWVTSKTLGQLFVYPFKLGASFRSHLLIQIGVMSRKCKSGGKSFWTLCPWPPIPHLVLWHGHHFGSGNYFWSFHDDIMTKTLWARCERREERWMDWETGGRKNRAVWGLLGRG